MSYLEAMSYLGKMFNLEACYRGNLKIFAAERTKEFNTFESKKVFYVKQTKKREHVNEGCRPRKPVSDLKVGLQKVFMVINKQFL